MVFSLLSVSLSVPDNKTPFEFDNSNLPAISTYLFGRLGEFGRLDVGWRARSWRQAVERAPVGKRSRAGHGQT